MATSPKTVAAPADDADVKAPSLKKTDLIARAADKSGLKKKDLKPATDAILAALSDALMAGEELVLPPLGRIKVIKSKDLPKGKMLTMKLKSPSAQEIAKDADAPLAEPAE